MSLENGSEFVSAVSDAFAQIQQATGNFDELSTLLPSLRTTLTRSSSWAQQARETAITAELRRHYDIDALFIGVSHDACDWGRIPRFGKTFSIQFKASYEKQTGARFHGSLVIDSEDAHEEPRRIPMRSLKQRLVAVVHLGAFTCDLVVFGPESEAFQKTDFYPRVKSALLKAVDEHKDSSDVNHLFCSLSNDASQSFTISSRKQAARVLRSFQRNLSSEHHVALVSLGCKAMGVVSRMSDIAGRDLAGVFDFLLQKSLKMDDIRKHATYLLCDNGIELSASGRYVHWKPEACRLFKRAMGTGSCYFQFGIRQLTAFNTRAIIFERYQHMMHLTFDPIHFTRHPEHRGVVPKLPARKKDISAPSIVVGKCAYTRSSDMVGRGSENPLAKIDFLSHLTEVVLSSGGDSTHSGDAKARQALAEAQSHVKLFSERLASQFTEGRRIEARGEVTCVRFIRGEEPEPFDALWSAGVADVFERLLIPDNISSVDTVALGRFAQHFTEILWSLMRWLGTTVLDAKAVTSSFGLGQLEKSHVDGRATMLHLVAMTAFCEQTLTHTFPFCNVMGVPGLCDRVSRQNGWENPLEAFVWVMGKPEIDIARFVSHNRLSLDTRRTDVIVLLKPARILIAKFVFLGNEANPDSPSPWCSYFTSASACFGQPSIGCEHEQSGVGQNAFASRSLVHCSIRGRSSLVYCEVLGSKRNTGS